MTSEVIPQVLPHTRGTLWMLSGLMLVLFAITNLPWELDTYDQAKQAWTSYEMVTEGHWFYQRTSDDQGLATKPPLTGWTSALIFLITRSWDIAWRLPPFVCAILLAWLLFSNASRHYGYLAGVVAFAAFSFNLLTPRLATLVRSDMPLAFVIFLIGLLHWQKIKAREAWNARDRWVLFGWLTAGMLIKGPIIYAFLLPGIIVSALYQRRSAICSASLGRGGDRRYGIWAGWWPWIVSLGIFLIWVIAGCLRVPRFYELVVVREFLARFGEVGTHVHRAQPLWFYLPHLLHKFLPWSVLMIGLLIVDQIGGWRTRSKLDGIMPSSSSPESIGSESAAQKLDGIKPSSLADQSDRNKISPKTFWLFAWAFGGLVLMSLIPSKRVDRIFPVIPPLCFLVAIQAANFLKTEQARRRNMRWIAAAVIIAILFSGGYSIARVVGGYREHRNALSIFGRKVRDEAVKNHWRYEAVGKTDEGLPLYLTRPHFLRPEAAVAKWNSGEIDALAVPQTEAPDLMRQMRDSRPRFESATRGNLRRPNYVLLTH